MNFVVEWITIDAPCSIGLQIIGAAVLSTIRGIPIFFPILATSSIGNIFSFGFGSVSAKYALVFSSVAFKKFSGFAGSTNLVSIP